MHLKQGVSLTGRNRTAPPRQCRPPAALQTMTDDDRRQTPTDDSVQTDTGPLGGPVIRCISCLNISNFG